MLELTRFINKMDVEDVTLLDRSKYNVYEDGMWLTPQAGVNVGKWTMSASDTVSTDAATRMAKMVWMEKGRTDARAVGKMSVISGGGVRGKTDVFVAASAASMLVGVELTIKKDADGVVKFDVATSGDVVKAIVHTAPADDAKGLLHFELV